MRLILFLLILCGSGVALAQDPQEVPAAQQVQDANKARDEALRENKQLKAQIEKLTASERLEASRREVTARAKATAAQMEQPCKDANGRWAMLQGLVDGAPVLLVGCVGR